MKSLGPGEADPGLIRVDPRPARAPGPGPPRPSDRGLTSLRENDGAVELLADEINSKMHLGTATPEATQAASSKEGNGSSPGAAANSGMPLAGENPTNAADFEVCLEHAIGFMTKEGNGSTPGAASNSPTPRQVR
eukprot:gene29189-31089_t